MDGAKRPPANLLAHQVLVDAVLGGAVIFAVAVLGARIEGFLGPSVLCCTPHCITIAQSELFPAKASSGHGSAVRQHVSRDQSRGLPGNAEAFPRGTFTAKKAIKRTFTRRVDEAARLWCRSGLWYAGVDLFIVSAHHYVNSAPQASTHMYLMGVGRASAPRAGTSSLGVDVYIWGMRESEACLAGSDGGCDMAGNVVCGQ
jgi:hypothetical protein